MKDKCIWITDDDEYFISGCGVNYRYISQERNFSYCPFCGKKVYIATKHYSKWYEKIFKFN